MIAFCLTAWKKRQQTAWVQIFHWCFTLTGLSTNEHTMKDDCVLPDSVEEEAADGMGTDISLVFHPDRTVNKQACTER